jgi:hypothetical protein
MKTLLVLFVALFSFSFCPITEKEEANNKSAAKEESITKSGYYVLVQDYTDRTSHQYLIESKDSVNKIFNQFFCSELELRTINYPITIDDGKQGFFVARVNLFESKNGKTKFKHLKYPKIYHKRKQQDPTNF